MTQIRMFFKKWGNEIPVLCGTCVILAVLIIRIVHSGVLGIVEAFVESVIRATEIALMTTVVAFLLINVYSLIETFIRNKPGEYNFPILPWEYNFLTFFIEFTWGLSLIAGFITL